ncbi:MAG TPA: hypothetical protein VHR42_10415 [Clostridia bacterium]|nr:hypothetical protein [Clostridia bacterium]
MADAEAREDMEDMEDMAGMEDGQAGDRVFSAAGISERWARDSLLFVLY